MTLECSVCVKLLGSLLIVYSYDYLDVVNWIELRSDKATAQRAKHRPADKRLIGNGGGRPLDRVITNKISRIRIVMFISI